MIENALYFALGGLLTGLLALLCLPHFWRRALRLSTRSLEMQLPLSMTEIVAERDQLRAEFAMEQRRLEKRSEDLLDARARDMAELGRRARHIATLESEIVEVWRESEARAGRLATLGDELTSARAELGVSQQLHWDTEGRLNNKTRAHAELLDQHQDALAHIDEQRATVAGLETRIAAHEADLQDLRAAHQLAQVQTLDLSRAVLAFEDQHAAARSEADALAVRYEQTLAQLRDAQTGADEFERQLRIERRQRMHFETELESQTAALARAEEREASLREEHANRISAMSGGTSDMLQKLEHLRTENAALQGALTIARQESARRMAYTGRDGGAGLDDPDEAAQLRRAIAEIGAKVARLVEEGGVEDVDGERRRAGAAE